MLNIGPQELLLILVVALLVVGPARLPELGRTIGKGLRELRKAQDEVRRTIQVSLDEPPAPARGRPARTPGTGTRAATSTDGDTSPNGLADPDAARASTAGAAVSEAVAAAHEASPPEEATDDTPPATEVARTLGRSLAELRRAREEIQRTFRVDVDGRSMSGGPARTPGATPPAPTPARSSASDAPGPTPAPEAAHDGATGSPDETPVP